jgi:hypothetical protein
MRTYEEHKEFLLGFIDIQLEFAFDKSAELSMPLDKVITNYTMIQDLTDFNKCNIFDGVNCEDKDWLAFVKQFNSLDKAGMVELINQVLEKRIVIDLPNFNASYNNKSEQENSCISLHPKDTGILELHVYNNFYPRSFVELSLRRDIINMLKDIPSDIEYIYMSSWLNQLPIWKKYFPNGYLVESNVYKTVEHPSIGLFGQFITHDYKVARSTVNYYKKHRKVRYDLQDCYVSVKSLKDMYCEYL